MRELDALLALADSDSRFDWLKSLRADLAQALDERRNGNLPRWRESVRHLPPLQTSDWDLCSDTVRIGNPSECCDKSREQLRQRLLELHPWRKGPYQLFGVSIDTEWRSDWKWQRLCTEIEPLSGRLVLDVGCGNGYHMLRMLGDGASRVFGVDPSALFYMQFQSLIHYLPELPIHLAPLPMEALPDRLRLFDTVFSMGVLYHRRSPIDHLLKLHEMLRSSGQLVLETLVVDGDERQLLLPQGRYAKMGNVWFLPSCGQLITWLQRCGFEKITVVDLSTTSVEEQRATDWMRFESLSDFLDPQDRTRTIEGYPAPRRAIVVAQT